MAKKRIKKNRHFPQQPTFGHNGPSGPSVSGAPPLVQHVRSVSDVSQAPPSIAAPPFSYDGSSDQSAAARRNMALLSSGPAEPPFPPPGYVQPGYAQVDEIFPPSVLRTAPEAPPVATAAQLPVSVRENAERAEKLARALSTILKQEIERLEDKRLNEPEWQTEIDFLKFVSASLDQIATAMGEARRSTTPEDREQKFNQAETLAKSLAGACRNFAERNYERVMDYAGFSAFTVLGTLLFTQWFGVSPEVALAGQLALLGLSRKPK